MTSMTVKVNRTGLDMAAQRGIEMLEGAEASEPSTMGDGGGLHENRLAYRVEGELIGSPPPGVDGPMAMLLDKLGERLAFERAGVRLYEALLDKVDEGSAFAGGPSRADLEHIREEEAQHFLMLEEAVRDQGGDPTVLTPCADLALVEGMGIQKVVTDPRTTLIQALHSILVVELTDNAGWELLIALARHVGVDELATRCKGAHEQEQEHLTVVRGWVLAHATRAEVGRQTGGADLDTH